MSIPRTRDRPAPARRSRPCTRRRRRSRAPPPAAPSCWPSDPPLTPPFSRPQSPIPSSRPLSHARSPRPGPSWRLGRGSAAATTSSRARTPHSFIFTHTRTVFRGESSNTPNTIIEARFNGPTFHIPVNGIENPSRLKRSFFHPDSGIEEARKWRDLCYSNVGHTGSTFLVQFFPRISHDCLQFPSDLQWIANYVLHGGQYVVFVIVNQFQGKP